MKPIVSIIVPIYNTEKYLRECIDSVLSQTIDLELILVDDCSTDNSLTIIEEYANKDDRIKVVKRKSNYGASASRNDGLLIATGKYIYCLDSDDSMIENALEPLINYMEDEKLDGLFLDCVLNMEDYLESFIHYTTTAPCDYSNINDGYTLFCKQIKSGKFVASVPRYIWRTEFIKKSNVNFVEGIMYEDNIFTIQLLLFNPHIKYKKTPIFNRRVHTGSVMTSSYSFNNLYSAYIVYLNMVNFLDINNLSEELIIAINKNVNLWEKETSILIRRNMNNNTLNQLLEEVETSNYPKKDELYRFIAIQATKKHGGFFDNDTLKQLKEVSQIIIYGAGIYAKHLIEELNDYNLEIICLAVTNKLDKPSYIYGYKVKMLSDFTENLDIPVAIAVKNHEEMEEYSRNLGFKNLIICKKNEEYIW